MNYVELGSTTQQNKAAKNKTPPRVTKGSVNPPASYRAPPTVGPIIIPKKIVDKQKSKC